MPCRLFHVQFHAVPWGAMRCSGVPCGADRWAANSRHSSAASLPPSPPSPHSPTCMHACRCSASLDVLTLLDLLHPILCRVCLLMSCHLCSALLLLSHSHSPRSVASSFPPLTPPPPPSFSSFPLPLLPHTATHASDLSSNNLTGPLPTAIDSLSELQFLYVPAIPVRACNSCTCPHFLYVPPAAVWCLRSSILQPRSASSTPSCSSFSSACHGTPLLCHLIPLLCHRTPVLSLHRALRRCAVSRQLRQNNFSGNIPPAIGSLSKLTGLYVPSTPPHIPTCHSAALPLCCTLPLSHAATLSCRNVSLPSAALQVLVRVAFISLPASPSASHPDALFSSHLASHLFLFPTAHPPPVPASLLFLFCTHAPLLSSPLLFSSSRSFPLSASPRGCHLSPCQGPVGESARGLHPRCAWRPFLTQEPVCAPLLSSS
ncbi:unnamed protein product [Closterium sp. NIES-54]